MADDPKAKPVELLAQQNQQLSMQLDQVMQLAEKQKAALETKQVEADNQMRVEQMKIESSDRQAALKAQVDLVKLEGQLTSTENIALLKVQIAEMQAQITRMASGQAAEESASEPEMPPPVAAGPAAPMGAM